MTAHQPPDETMWMDRLVDGDLDEPSRRALLLRLDALPDGWRRLALAFLEAQSWREALGPIAREGLEPSRAPLRRVSPWTAARPWLARAAGVLVVFAVGWGVGRSRDQSAAVPGHDPIPGAIGGMAEAPRPAGPDPTPAPEAPTEYVQAPAPAPAPIAEPPAARWAAASSAADDEAARLLSEQARDRLQRQGFEVQRRSAFAAVQLQDGRQALIPIEDVMVRYVGSRVY